jgi:octopine/nopaline transport system substrate-binding protein
MGCLVLILIGIAMATGWIALAPPPAPISAPRSTSPAETAQDAIVIGTEGAFPPWNFTRPDGTLDGFEPELMRDLCRRANLSCRVVAMDWDGMVGALHARKIDVIADSVQITPARLAVLAFSRPYALTTGVFGSQKGGGLTRMADRGVVLDLDRPSPEDAGRIAQLRKELRGKIIGIAISGAYDSFVNRYLKDVVTIKYYRTMGERDLDLLNGRLDITLEDAAYMSPLLATRDGAMLQLVGPELIGGEMGRGEALALRQSDPAHKAQLNAAIGAAIADGTIRRLGLKWFSMDATPPAGGAGQ